MYFTVTAFAFLLVMAFNINTNSMNANAIDFGLISKDTNIGGIDTDSLFNCVGAAITCDNDNTVNNNIAVNNGTNGNGGGNGGTPLPPLENCVNCLVQVSVALTGPLADLLDLGDGATIGELCLALNEVATIEDLVLLLNAAGFTNQGIVDLLVCFGIDITLEEVEAIIGV